MEKQIKVINKNVGGGGGAVYGLGFIGALVYYIVNYTDISTFLFGVVKSIFWPAFLIYRALELLQI